MLSSPLLLAAVVAVRLESHGSPIYRQLRVGKDGRPFELYKLRTMVTGAEHVGAGLAVNVGDPRITRVGALLRRFSLDELPNLVNVLGGEMSIVGPRPTIRAQVDQYTDDQRRRLEVKPGITGWAQVRRGYTADAAGTRDKLSFDLWYLRHRSLVVDLAICAKTFSTLLTGSGAR